MSCVGMAVYQSDLTIATPATQRGQSEYIFADLFLNKPYTNETLPERYAPLKEAGDFSADVVYRQVNAMIFRRNFGKITRYYPLCNAISPLSMLMTASLIVTPVVFMIEDRDQRWFALATFHEDFGTDEYIGKPLPKEVDNFCQCNNVIVVMSNGFLSIELFGATAEGDTDLVARLFGNGRHPSVCREVAQDFARYSLNVSGDCVPPKFPEIRDYALRSTLTSVLSQTSPATADVEIEPENRFGIPEGKYTVEVKITKK